MKSNTARSINLFKLTFTFSFRFLFNPKYYDIESSGGSTINVVAILLGDYGRSLPDLHCKRIDANITINYTSLYRTEQILARLDTYCLANDSPVCLISGSVSNHHPLSTMLYWPHIEWTRCIEYTNTYFQDDLYAVQIRFFFCFRRCKIRSTCVYIFIFK